jgi:hypothetical protein
MLGRWSRVMSCELWREATIPGREAPRAFTRFVVTAPLVAVVAWWIARPPAEPLATNLPAIVEAPVGFPERTTVAEARVASVPPRRPSCPPPRSDAPLVAEPPVDDSFASGLEVAPTNAAWVVAWSSEQLAVSLDAGASFSTPLEVGDDDNEPYEEAYFEVATFDCHGHLAAVRGDRIAVLDGPRVTWTAEPGSVRLVGGGPDIVAIAEREDSVAVRVSRDVGRTWTTHVVLRDLDGLEIHTSGVQEASGRIRVAVTTTSLGDAPRMWWLHEVVIDDGGMRATAPVQVAGPVDLSGDVAIAIGDGAVYQRDRGRVWQRVIGLPEPGEARYVPGPWPLVVAKGALYRIDRGRARRIRDWPADKGRNSWTPALVDRASRIWAIENHESVGCDGTSRPIQLGRAR